MKKHMNVYTLNKYGNNIKCNRHYTLYKGQQMQNRLNKIVSQMRWMHANAFATRVAAQKKKKKKELFKNI